MNQAEIQGEVCLSVPIQIWDEMLERKIRYIFSWAKVEVDKSHQIATGAVKVTIHYFSKAQRREAESFVKGFDIARQMVWMKAADYFMTGDPNAPDESDGIKDETDYPEGYDPELGKVV